MNFLDEGNENFYQSESSSSLNPDAISGGSYEQTNKMNIYVLQPFSRIRHIKLNPKESISVLNQLYLPDSTYIHKGKILDITKSFLFYRISNESKIVNISPVMAKNNPNFIEKWLKITSDSENFEKKIETSINKKNRNEIARLKDMKLNKCELRKKHLGAYLTKCVNRKVNDVLINDNDQPSLKIDFESTDSPSCNPLPVLW